ncbi:MAG: M14 family metallocarboxypeptidase [Bacteroidales bacterium]
MRNKIIGLMFLICAVAGAQQPGKVTSKFFPEPDMQMNTPLFQKSRGFTGYKEMMKFIEDLRLNHPDLIRIEKAGETQKGRDIPLVTIGRKENAEQKINILLMGRVHGNEPIGTEGLLYFMQQILENPEKHDYLDKINFYIMPMVNIDGGERNNRNTANGIDLNRDQSKLDSPEAVAMHAVANKILPHLFVDFHEYQPMKSDLFYISDGKVLSNPTDVMFLYSSNPNVAAPIRNAVDQLILPGIGKRMDQNGLTHQTYYTSSSSNGNIRFTQGGTSPRSSANSMALKNSISVLVEVRGVGLERISVKRRLNTVFVFADELAKIACDQAARIKDVCAQAEAERSDIVVEYTRSDNPAQEVQFLDMVKNRLITLPVHMLFSTESKPTLTRKRPKAYYILPTQKKAFEKLTLLGVDIKPTDQEVILDLECYLVISAIESSENISGMYPLQVKTEVSDKRVTLPAGTLKIEMNQRNANLIGSLLEPESSNGFVNYRVIDGKLHQELPIYREKN